MPSLLTRQIRYWMALLFRLRSQRKRNRHDKKRHWGEFLPGVSAPAESRLSTGQVFLREAKDILNRFDKSRKPERRWWSNPLRLRGTGSPLCRLPLHWSAHAGWRSIWYALLYRYFFEPSCSVPHLVDSSQASSRPP